MAAPLDHPALARYRIDGQALGHAMVTGRAAAIDGDTLAVGGVRVRLEGIDAPELEQTCNDAEGRTWACGRAAQSWLARAVANRLVSCEDRGLDKYRRVLGICSIDGRNLNAELVRRGLAWAFVRYSRSYVDQEHDARRQRVGIWSGPSRPAWEYRHGSWHQALATAPAGCPIKGNVSPRGRIYHMPWSPWYRRIRMDQGKGKRWFCSEAEAIKAGWRPAGKR
ncbi:MAG: thermonuclease family protein [Hyphomicrobiaceae bacterium]